MAGLPLVAVILTPLATLTMIAVVSLPALYPAAVANVRMFTSVVFDVISSVRAPPECPPWTIGINILLERLNRQRGERGRSVVVPRDVHKKFVAVRSRQVIAINLRKARCGDGPG